MGLVLLALPLDGVRAQADSLRATPTPAIVTGGDVAGLALALGATALAYPADEGLRRAVRGDGAQRSDALGALADFGYGYGQPGVVGLGAALWLGGLATRRATPAAVGLRALEAIAVSGTITSVLKGSVGRARPRVSPVDNADFEFWRGWRSGVGSEGDYAALPSGHATAAFAFAAAVTSEVAHRAPRHARWVALTTYGAASVTAWSRLHDDAHWLSDVTLGAGIGIVSGLAVTRWHRTRPDNWIDGWLLRPVIAPGAEGTLRVGGCLCPR